MATDQAALENAQKAKLTLSEEQVIFLNQQSRMGTELKWSTLLAFYREYGVSHSPMELVAGWKLTRFEKPQARALVVSDDKVRELYAEIMASDPEAGEVLTHMVNRHMEDLGL